MADERKSGSGNVPWGQRLFDRPFVLLALGRIVMFVIYTGWGVVEILTMPTATLP